MTSSNYFDKKQNRQVLIITGLSGSGKSNVMRTLEDLGFYCVDNLPIPLIATFLELAFQAHTNVLKVALGIDSRGQRFLRGFLQKLEKIKKQEHDLCKIRVVFLNASSNTILKRFQETRRNHPLARAISIEEAIEKERELLDPIKKFADIIYDTDRSTVHDLRRWVMKTFSKDYNQKIIINVVSFGFKYGVPAESNLVYDVRFLPNPYFVSNLKPLDGRNIEIQKYLFSKPEVTDYWNRLRDFAQYSIKKYYEEGRFFANIAIGCTGGKHRSVAFVDRLGKEKWDNVQFLVHHRDVEKER
jgi:RNase adapter protein RapZ